MSKEQDDQQNRFKRRKSRRVKRKIESPGSLSNGFKPKHSERNAFGAIDRGPRRPTVKGKPELLSSTAPGFSSGFSRKEISIINKRLSVSREAESPGSLSNGFKSRHSRRYISETQDTRIKRARGSTRVDPLGSPANGPKSKHLGREGFGVNEPEPNLDDV